MSREMIVCTNPHRMLLNVFKAPLDLLKDVVDLASKTWRTQSKKAKLRGKVYEIYRLISLDSVLAPVRGTTVCCDLLPIPLAI